MSDDTLGKVLGTIAGFAGLGMVGAMLVNRRGGSAVNPYGHVLENPKAYGGVHPLSLEAFVLKANPALAASEEVITSRRTCRPVVAQLLFELVRSRNLKKGDEVLDVGAGRFDLGKEYLNSRGIVSIPYDPYNRTEEENQRALDVAIRGDVDACLCSNVLNVVRDPVHRAHVVWLCAQSVRFTGGKSSAWFAIWEGTKSGKGKLYAGDMWQENRKASTYLKEIRPYFHYVEPRILYGLTVIQASCPKLDESP